MTTTRLTCIAGWSSPARSTALVRENPRWFPIEGEEADRCRQLRRSARRRRGRAALPRSVRGVPDARRRDVAAGRPGARQGGRLQQRRSVPFNGPVRSRMVPWVAGDLGTTIGIATGAALALPARRLGPRVRVQPSATARPIAATSTRREPGGVLAAAHRLRLPEQRLGDLAAGRLYLPAPVVARAPATAFRASSWMATTSRRSRAVVGEAIERARSGEGPTLIEARTWRQRGHWAGDTSSPPRTGRRRRRPRSAGDSGRATARTRAASGRAPERSQRAGRRRGAAAFDRARALPDAGDAELGLDEVFA